MPDIIINDKVKQDEEEIIVGPNDKVPTFCGKMQTMKDRGIMTIL